MIEKDYIELDWFERWAKYTPNAIALQMDDSGEKVSYKQAASKINQLAEELKEKYDVSYGDRVAVLSLNSIEYVLLYFAVQKLGAILLPLNFRLTSKELEWPMEDATPSALFYEENFRLTVEQISNRPEKCEVISNLFESAKTQSSNHIEHQGEFESPSMILYTSGTTGRPKGAVITNKMIFWNSVNTGLRLNLTQKDVTLTFAPFFHTGGWNVLTTPFLHRGARLILSNKFDPDLVLQLCDKESVTILFGVPTMMDMMFRSESFAKSSLKTIRYAIVGGEPMSKSLITSWHEKGIPIRQGYGLTEFGPNVFSLNEEDAIRKIGSIGFPNFYIETRVVDDNGNNVEVNQPGELLLRGPACMPGYWENEEATTKTINKDGWLHTGDIVRCDEEGYFYVMDRKKDMFISGAENVYPAEVEHVLRTMPGIRDAAVIGVPDEKWGESGMAFIIKDMESTVDEDSIIQFCRENLAKYKIPKHIRFVDDFPKSDSGKILKRKLRELA